MNFKHENINYILYNNYYCCGRLYASDTDGLEHCSFRNM